MMQPLRNRRDYGEVEERVAGMSRSFVAGIVLSKTLTAAEREAAVADIIKKIYRRIRDSELAKRMVEKVTQFFKTRNERYDLTPREVSMLYHGDDYGDTFDLNDGRELDIDWSKHAVYRSQLRDIDPSRVNEQIRNYAEGGGRRVRKKVNLLKGRGKTVVHVDTTGRKGLADVITVIASRIASDHVKKVFKAPEKIENPDNLPCVFLAGSIDMGKAEDWQSKITSDLDETACIVINPRRDDWDSSWTQSIDNDQFREQVEWELDGMDMAKVIAMHFSKESQAPISLLELGLHAAGDKMVVFCPEGYWRKGNVDVVCKRYNVPVYGKYEDWRDAVKKRLDEKSVRVASIGDRVAGRMMAREFVSANWAISGKVKVAAGYDLGEIKAVLPAWEIKKVELRKLQEQQLREFNRQYNDARKSIEEMTKDLTNRIARAIVAYFNKSGRCGVRKVDTGSLTEVFLGDKDGVKRVDSKVSAHVVLGIGTRDTYNFMLRNEGLQSIEGDLKDRNTGLELLKIVDKAYKKGFWE